MNKVDQGSIYYGFRSEKYPDIKCYAVVISARCDIAQHKIKKYYYLIALDVLDWLQSPFGCAYALEGFQKNVLNSLSNKLNTCQINIDLLLSFGSEQREKVLLDKVSKPADRKWINEKLSKVVQLQEALKSKAKLSELIKSDEKAKNAIKDTILEISKSKHTHYVYIPQKSYLSEGSLEKGLIIDLQEIGILTEKDANIIESPGIDYSLLSGLAKEDATRQKKQFFLNNEEDFVGFEGKIESPWIEYTVQRFSNNFIRIGIEDLEENVVEGLVGRL